MKHIAKRTYYQIIDTNGYLDIVDKDKDAWNDRNNNFFQMDEHHHEWICNTLREFNKVQKFLRSKVEKNNQRRFKREANKEYYGMMEISNTPRYRKNKC